MSQQTLVVDLDGTLIKSDTTYELLVLCARWKPHLLIPILFSIIFDRARAKDRLAELVGGHIDPKHLPYEQRAIELIERHREAGHQVWLVSGSPERLVTKIGDHLGCFDKVKGSSTETNLTASKKAAFLSDCLPDGYVYAGNSRQDYAVWRAAGAGYGFQAPRSAYRLTTEENTPVRLDKQTDPPSTLRSLRKAMRLHQWAKNILIFVVPGLMLDTLTSAHLVGLLLGFSCFGFMASGTYLLNDLFDIQDDRAHRTKRLRPLAAGDLGIPTAILTAGALVSISLVGAAILSWPFFAVLSLYGVTTIAYSFRLKRLPVLDVMILAGLFTLRVWAGAVLVDAPPTAWLFTFIGLVFLSLALAKRYVEVNRNAAKGKVAGRGYQAEDEPVLLAFGAAASYASVLSLAIYGLLAPDRLIDSPYVFLALGVIVAGWFMRLWLIAVRGDLDDDPVLFAVKDRTSLLCLVTAASIVLIEKAESLWGLW